MEEKSINTTAIIITIVVVILLGTGIYNFFFAGQVIKDETNYFRLHAPNGYDFIVNPNNKEKDDPYNLAVYDRNKAIYIYGMVYELPEGDIKTLLDEDKVEFVESSNGKDITETEIYKIEEYEIYKYDFNYIDVDEVEYYIQVYWILTEDKIYSIDIECKLSDKEKYKDELKKIIDSFREL